MTYVITAGCIDVMDRACVDVCPVDCIYEGGRKLYIQPDECIDCGACAEACPQSAIFFDEETPADLQWFVGDAVSFFTEVLPGRDEPLDSPGAAAEVGPLGVDTPRVTEFVVA